MNGGRYLIPANSKKSEMILGVFTNTDLILFLTGVGLTVTLLLAIRSNNFWTMILILLPALTAGFLVFPIPNYHNVLQLIINVYTFFFTRPRQYIWKGWCVKDGFDKQKER